MNRQQTAVYIVDGCRTPFLKATGRPGPFAAADLLVAAGRTLLGRQPFAPETLSEVIIGSVIPAPDEVNIARVFSQRLGCGPRVPAWTVQRNCGSGMQALETGADRIRDGHSSLVLVGGVDAMSHAPVLVNPKMVAWLSDFTRARGGLAKLRRLLELRPGHFRLVFGILQGLTDPVVRLNMGQTAEILAEMFAISRGEMDRYSLRSHQRLARAMDQGWLDEVVPLYAPSGQVYEEDDGLRRDSSLERLARLRPVFDPRFGRISAGNGAQITDGAALLLLAGAEAVDRFQLEVLGSIEDTHWAGLDPAQMGLGPVHAVAPLLERNDLGLEDIDYWELNEAFAAQVLACLKAFADPEYCASQLKRPIPWGNIDQERINIDGGAISLGHPVGASGARIVLHLLHVLRRQQARLGIATLCIGGGQGGAMLLRNQACSNKYQSSVTAES
ncbi:acetyl-CoA C-acetyltransferase [Desulfogranum mediterraneum]|uniref:acetyl-CoA C-acetyltransferase n=1 Tax=Desulfogranum mediterraneum TaxID=160661 RepID=UPI000403FBB7|nr:acetyl-CoA C-acetyltransferase [Desulfogranum mediterraneum]